MIGIGLCIGLSVVGAGWGGETGEVALLEYRDAPVQGSLVVATGGGGDATAPGARYLEAPINNR